MWNKTTPGSDGPSTSALSPVEVIRYFEIADRHGRATVSGVDGNVVRVNTGCPEQASVFDHGVEVFDSWVEVVD